MKIVSSHQMAEMEAQAYRSGASAYTFMQEAGSGVAIVAHDYAERMNLDRQVYLLCGKGNNAGDAYVAGIDLLHLDYNVMAYQIAPLEECSPLCQEHYRKFLDEGGQAMVFPFHESVRFASSGIIIDGLFGTGFKGSTHEPCASLIRLANRSNLPIIAVDIPSGLNGESGIVEGDAIMAAETAFLGLPKRGFFIEQGWDYVGKLRYVDFGLPEEFILACETSLEMITPKMVKPFLPKIKNSRHKYQAGSVAALAGSAGMPGAAIMSSFSTLRGGAGIVKLLHPESMTQELAAAPYEVIKVAYQYENPAPVIELLNHSSACLIGPGFGTHQAARSLLECILSSIESPCVIDADALTLIATYHMPIPRHAVLTPHHGEMARLFQESTPTFISETFLARCQAFADEHEITLVLKGGPTFIFDSGEPILVCPHGTPGMATAGSGDVLTGIIAALLAQGAPPRQAAALGVYLHGVAGEHAAADWTPYCMIATDILFHLPEAFGTL